MQIELLDGRQTWDSRTRLANVPFEQIEVFAALQRRHSTLNSTPHVDYDWARPTAPAVAV